MNSSNITCDFEKIVQIEKELKAFERNMDYFFNIIFSCIVVFMQAGFALLECGAVRAKNTTNILLKNILDSFISGIAYWATGYALAKGSESNFFMGWRYWFAEGLTPDLYSDWFFNYVFAATAATIVSGAVAERCEFSAYFIYSIVITGFIYPIVTHWGWSSNGWLAVGYWEGIVLKDFAGSGIVHLLGGVAALMGAVFLGPRLHRFDEATGKPKRMSGHSVPLSALGAFILFFGFFAFNGVSQGSISQPGDGEAVARAIVTTVLSATAAAFTVLFVKRLSGDKTWSLLETINGALIGMVAMCAGCNAMLPWAAFITGIIAGCTYLFWSWLLLRLQVDDPMNAFAVHGGGGFWGLIAVALLADDGIILSGVTPVGPWKQLAWQLVGALAIIVWSAVLCGLVFFLLRVAGLLRVSEEFELKGLDIPKHGEPAYPDDAYRHGWKNFYTHDIDAGDALSALMKRMQHTKPGDRPSQTNPGSGGDPVMPHSDSHDGLGALINGAITGAECDRLLGSPDLRTSRV